MSAALTNAAAIIAGTRGAFAHMPASQKRFYKNKFFAVAVCVLLTHSFDDMVYDINRIKRHTCLHFSRRAPQLRVIWQSLGFQSVHSPGIILY